MINIAKTHLYKLIKTLKNDEELTTEGVIDIEKQKDKPTVINSQVIKGQNSFVGINKLKPKSTSISTQKKGK